MIFLKWYLILMITLILLVKLIYRIKKKHLYDELLYILICLMTFYIPILTYIIFN